MDAEVKDMFNGIIERLDTVQRHQQSQQQTNSYLDQIVKRLDTIQGCLDKQTQQQSILEEKFSCLYRATNLDKGTDCLQASENQTNALSRPSELQAATKDVHMHDLAANNEEGPELTPANEKIIVKTLSPQNASEVALDESESISKDSVAADFTSDLTFLSKVTAEIKESVQTEVTKMTEALQESFQGVRRTELSWLNNQLDDRLSQLTTTITETFQQSRSVTEAPVNNGHLPLEACKTQMTSPTTKSREDDQTLLLASANLDKEIQTSRCDIDELNDGSMTAKLGNDAIATSRNVEDDIKTSMEKLSKNTDSMKEEIKAELQTYCYILQQNIQASVDQNNQKLQEVTTSVVDELKSTRNNLKETIVTRTEQEPDQCVYCANTKRKENMMQFISQQIQDTKRHVNISFQESNAQLEDYMYKIKREIFAVTEKEAQLIRDRIFGFLVSSKSYTFDFYVENFKALVNSAKGLHSPPWHIKQFQSSLQGYVRFTLYGQMRVGLVFARHPREIGLQPRSCGRLRCKAIITDTTGILPDVLVGEETGTWDEREVKNNGDWGSKLGVVSCDELLVEGYGEREGYLNGAVLVRFEIEVL